MTHIATRVAVTLVFGLMYLAFLFETLMLFREFGTGPFGFHVSNLYAQNFVFFPIAGALGLIAFWRPATLLVDAMAKGLIAGGQVILPAAILLIGSAGWAAGSLFDNADARSIFEIAPVSVLADAGEVTPDGTVIRAPIAETLVKMRINAAGEGGLSPYKARCDAEWLRFSVTADEQMLCFPTGHQATVAECCQARERYRLHLNTLQARAPSVLAQVHRLVIPVKSAFLFMLLAIGLLLARYRKRLQTLYGEAVDDLSFGVAMGGAVMLLWPLMNAAHLETIALLTGDGTSNAYTVMAPLISLGFAVFAVVLVFFHLRTYPHQIEYAAKIGGGLIAALGVFRYEEIVTYLSRTLGIGGGPVAVVVFTVAIGAIIAAVMLGVTADTFDDGDDEEDDTATKKGGG